MRLRLRRAALGAVLAQGAPLSWLLVRWIWSGVSPRQEIVGDPELYIYLFTVTTVIFTIFGFMVGRFEDRLATANEELQRSSRTDALTGLSNVRTLSEMLPKLISLGHRNSTSLSLIMLDIDRFKRINDLYGHLTGDDCLRDIGQLLLQGRRLEDLVARIGGEEFVIVLPGIDALGAERVAQRVIEAVRMLDFRAKNQSIAITVSAGVAELHEGDLSGDLLARADTAMYEAKRAGRNRVAVGPRRTTRVDGHSDNLPNPSSHFSFS